MWHFSILIFGFAFRLLGFASGWSFPNRSIILETEVQKECKYILPMDKYHIICLTVLSPVKLYCFLRSIVS